MTSNTLLVGILLAGLIAFGCHTQESPVNHADEFTENNVEILRLPVSKNSISRVVITKVATPADSTSFFAILTYPNWKNGTTKFDVKFKVPPGALSAPVLITMILDTAQAKIEFYPDGLQFMIPASLDVTLIGLDDIKKTDFIDFFYMNPNGNFDPKPFNRLWLTPNKGNVQMKEGKINHFSVYAFGRRKGAQNGW